LNLDFLLPKTPAVARKLAYLNRIATVNVDAETLALATDGLLNHEQVECQLPDKLRPYLNAEVLDIIQHSADHNHRFVLGTNTFAQSAAYSLMAVMATGNKALIVYERNSNSTTDWKAFIKHHGLNGCEVRSDEHEDYDATVLIVELSKMTASVISKTRNRVLICAQQAVIPGGRDRDDSDFELLDLFNDRVADELTQHVNQYPMAIPCFHVSPAANASAAIAGWNRSRTLRVIVKELYPNSLLEKLINHRHATLPELSDMGFSRSRPLHIAKLMGVHVDTLLKDPSS
jgi:hypothetical protein